ncbi:MAG: response regulator [Spirochaetes bacterium]|nr:MAG: response regulator [Spirochaetota bacterium]
MKKILIIDESSLFREYLSKKLNEFQFDILQGKNGLDGMVKLRNDLPDLVIMDYFLSRKSSIDLLQEKQSNPNISAIPVIMISSKVDKGKLLEIAKYGVKKVFTKPVKMDALLKTISSLLNVKLEIDATPCIIEAHFNDNILFIEIARGLNREKIELLKYKISELMELYQIKVPKVLIMMSNIELSSEASDKLSLLFRTVLEHTGAKPWLVKILTNSSFVKDYVETSYDFKGIGVTNNLSNAMDDLIGIRPDEFAHDDVVNEKFITASAPKKEKQESFQLKFEEEKVELTQNKLEALGKDITVAAVDDDIVIQELIKTVFSETGWKVHVYENGKKFIENLNKINFDLVFLDLMMPEMNGFEVLNHLKKNNIKVPIIIFSALSRKETVVKAVSFGIHSYIIKPLKPEMLLQKAAEILGANF